MHRRTTSFFINISLAAFMAVLLFSCDEGVKEGAILLTSSIRQTDQEAFEFNMQPKKLEGSQIVMFDPAHPKNSLLLVSEDFYSASGPSISFNARKMVFSAQKNKGDLWQIYEMRLADLHYEQLSNAKSNCLQPTYLPDNSIVYSKELRLKNGEIQYALFVIDQENSLEERITFSPGSYLSAKVLHDGRLITINQQEYLDNGEPNLMVMRPDGSKEMRFYKSNRTGNKVLSAKQMQSGEIYLLESNKQGKARLNTISYANPMGSRKKLSKNIRGDIMSIDPLANGNLLLCYKKLNEEHAGLYEFDPIDQQLVGTIYKNEKYTFSDAVSVIPRSRPKKIPSEVKIEEETALLLCQDINFIDPLNHTAEGALGKAVSIEVLGMDRSLGVVDAEKDGSVYLKVKADTPFQIQTLDENGNVMYGPSSWINLRPNERRACVGCHTGNEIVPENRQPLAVTKDPIEIPAIKSLLAKTE